jgi:hypothetical protein
VCIFSSFDFEGTRNDLIDLLRSSLHSRWIVDGIIRRWRGGRGNL